MSNFTVFTPTPSVFNSLTVASKLAIGEKLFYITKLEDFPTPLGNVISLPALSAWIILGDVDLRGNRINCLGQVSIQGTSSETSSLFSTGLPGGEAMLTSAFTLPLQNITFGCPDGTSVFNLQGDGTNGLDIVNVNFGSATLSCGTVGLIKDFSNFAAFNCAFLDINDGMTIDGTIGTVSFSQVLFLDGIANGSSYITLPATLTITRRVRVIFSSFVVLAGRTGIDLDAAATIPDLAFILNSNNFAGGGTYLNGIDAESVKARFTNNAGIENSSQQAQMTMIGNVTATPIAFAGTYVKILGTTTPSALNRQFTHSNNRLTYVGVETLTFDVSVVVSVSSGNNQDVFFRLAVDGVTDATSTQEVTTDAGGRRSNVKIQGLITLPQNSYIEIWTTNGTGTTAVLAVDLNLILIAH